MVICFIGLVELSHVFRHSDRPSSPMIALSSVSWNRDLTPQVGIFDLRRETVAFLLLLKDFKTPMSQEQIDSLYEGLKPDEQDQLRYRVASPSQVKEALVGAATPMTSISKNLVILLQNKLDVQKLVLVTLISEAHQIRVRSELVDARTGKQAGEAAEAPTTPPTLKATVRRLAYNSLNQKGSQDGPR